MRVLVDTNIRPRSAQPAHPLCSHAAYAVSKLLRQNGRLLLLPEHRLILKCGYPAGGGERAGILA